MNLFKNIFFFFTATLILLPSAVSFTHLFSEHTHKLCDNYAEHHYHAEAVDCELHHFQKNPALSINFPEYELTLFVFQEKRTFDYYQFLNDYEALAFDLRGPPANA